MVSVSDTPWVDDGRLARARQRKRELRDEREAARQRAEAERERIAAELLGDLDHPTARDRLAAKNLAALHTKAEQEEAQGLDSSGTRQQITQAMRAWSHKPAELVTRPQESLAAYLERTAAGVAK